MTDAREAAIAARIEESPPMSPSEIAFDVAAFGAGWDAAKADSLPEIATEAPEAPGRYEAARDSYGNIRLSRGRGALVATPTDTRADVQGWFDRAGGPKWARMYRAALDLLDVEAADTTTTKEN